MSTCRRLKVSEKAALVAQGWTVIGGPYGSETSCTEVCNPTGTATASASATGFAAEGAWWAASPPSGGQTGGEWWAGSN